MLQLYFFNAIWLPEYYKLPNGCKLGEENSAERIKKNENSFRHQVKYVCDKDAWEYGENKR